MITIRLFAAALVAAATMMSSSGCGNDFDPASRVTDFRLLAVQADRPYASPGEQVELRTLSHEPFGRPISWAWTTCVTPRDTTVNACLAKIAEDAQASGRPPAFTLGQESTFKTTIPANVLAHVAPVAGGNAWVGVVTVGCPGSLALADLAATPAGDLPFRCTDANTHELLPYERFVVSVKRIYIRRADRNQNPSASAVTWDGALWPESDVKETTACTSSPSAAYDDCEGGEAHDVALVVPPESIESGKDEFGAPFAEDVVAQYYATEGLFQFEARTYASAATKWKARASAVGKEHTLWFVARDNRGGVSWTTRKVRVK
jgi:hypothetical protein